MFITTGIAVASMTRAITIVTFIDITTTVGIDIVVGMFGPVLIFLIVVMLTTHVLLRMLSCCVC